MEWRTGSPSLQHYREASGNLVAVIPSGEPHRSVWQRRASKVNIYLCEHFLSAIASRVLPETRFELEAAHLVRDPFIEELGRAVYREYVEGAGHDLDRRFADSVADVLAMHLLRVYNARTELPSDSRGQLGPATSRRVRKYIEQYLEGDLSIETLAKVSGLSPNYFAEGFRRTTGFTPHHYVSRRRVDRARQLLIEDTALPLIDVAHRCGFKSQSQFTIVFRRITGVTPGKFRAGHATV
jgi:AraC family transcriptional regulator